MPVHNEIYTAITIIISFKISTALRLPQERTKQDLLIFERDAINIISGQAKY